VVSETGMAEFPIIENTKFEPDDEYIPVPHVEPGPPTWMDGSLRIGIHTSISGSHLNALESAKKLGANALQIFSASPRMWQTANVRIPEADVKAFRARREELGLGPLVIHANYLINLAASQPMLRTRSIQAFHEELVRGRELGADFVVVHPGSRGDSTVEQAIATIVDSVKQAARRVPLGKMRILIENTAGMGTAVGSRLEEVAAILYELNRGQRAGAEGRPEGRPVQTAAEGRPGIRPQHNVAEDRARFDAAEDRARLGASEGRSEVGPLQFAVCLDTAHLFAAGYDIKSEAGFEQTVETIDRILGLENVPVFHVNDSKIPLGGRVDRHENIGDGKIGAEAFARILRNARLGSAAPAGLPGRAFLLETPIEDPGDDRKNVAKLWELAGVEGPEAEKGFSMMTPGLKKLIAKGKKASARHLPAAGKKSGPRKK
jgi:deoxyribonuclease IV